MCLTHEGRRKRERLRERERERVCILFHWGRCFTEPLTTACRVCVCVCVCVCEWERVSAVWTDGTWSSIIRLSSRHRSVKTTRFSAFLFSKWRVNIVPQLWHHSQMFWSVGSHIISVLFNYIHIYSGPWWYLHIFKYWVCFSSSLCLFSLPQMSHFSLFHLFIVPPLYAHVTPSLWFFSTFFPSFLPSFLLSILVILPPAAFCLQNQSFHNPSPPLTVHFPIFFLPTSALPLLYICVNFPFSLPPSVLQASWDKISETGKMGKNVTSSHYQCVCVCVDL